MIVLDTDRISILQHEDSPKASSLIEKLESLPEGEAVTTAVTLITRLVAVARSVDPI